jgi:hypothetical protein
MTVVLVEIVKTNNVDGFALSFTFLASNLKPPTSNILASNTQYPVHSTQYPVPSIQQRENQ